MDKGAHYYKCDFQVHTPRDINWTGNGAISDDERKEYARDFVGKCREIGLDAVAITDHHDFALFPYIKQAAIDELDPNGKPYAQEGRLVVFPGIEITLSTPACQALLILDADFPIPSLEPILNFLGISPSNAAAAKTCSTVPISNTIVSGFDQLCAKLNTLDAVKNRYIVLPNLNENGRHTLLRAGNSEHYRKMPCVGGYVDGNVSQHGQGNTNIVNGIAREWGNKAIALFQTSDCRQRDFSQLAKSTTWVKWAVPTAEALRQACLAKESRISQSEPQKPSVHISQIDITNSKFLGTFSINFSEQYNAIIGGRGTGKSTILEYLRWGLCDQVNFPEDPEEQNEIERKRQSIIEKTLQNLGGECRIVFSINNIKHVIKRNSATDEILMKIGDADFEEIDEGQVRRILPIHAYSQKQLSSVGISFEELKRFVEQPIAEKLHSIDDNFSEIRKRISTSYCEMARKKEIAKELKQCQLEVKSLVAQILHLRSTIAGIDPCDQAIIADKPKIELETQLVQGYTDETQRMARKLSDISESLGSSQLQKLTGLDLCNPSLIDTIDRNTREKIYAVAAHIDRAKAELEEEAMVDISKAMAIWGKAKDEYETKYADVQKRTTANQSVITEIKRIEKRIGELQSIIREKELSTRDIGNPEVEFPRLRFEWSELHREKLALLAEQAKEFSEKSSGLIKAEIGKTIEIQKIKELLIESFNGTRIREDKVISICDEISKSDDPFNKWNNIIDELRLLSEINDDDVDSPKPNTEVLDKCGFNDGNKAKICEMLDTDKWLRLATTPIDFIPVFKYIANKELGDEILFTDASAGQQATALLSVLLNQAGGPLVIDQPEDDVDNKAIDEIIKNIWAAKQKRQLIFSSHNANMVVNGDAELVICCDYKDTGSQTRGIIKAEGAIDVPLIRNEITSVMEGGEKAFVLRKAKYGF